MVNTPTPIPTHRVTVVTERREHDRTEIHVPIALNDPVEASRLVGILRNEMGMDARVFHFGFSPSPWFQTKP